MQKTKNKNKNFFVAFLVVSSDYSNYNIYTHILTKKYVVLFFCYLKNLFFIYKYIHT